jgi:hypothetical protein
MVEVLFGGILGSDVTTTSGAFASIAVFSHVSRQKKV